MPTGPNKLSRIWQELKRRRVIHVIVVYATAAFVIIELVNNITEPLRLPDWTPTLVIIVLLIGLPLAIIFSWIFDMTSDGIQKTRPISEVRESQKATVSGAWKVATYICAIVILGLVTLQIIQIDRVPKDIFKLEKSIAVLPFFYYNLDPDAEDIGDAFANEIITQLYKVKGFDRIISHTSTLQYKGEDKPSISTIGKELGANFIIEGSLERQNDNVSIQIQIIHAASDDHIWAEDFGGKWDDIFAIRADIARKVAEELHTALSPDEIIDIEQKTTDDLRAYDYYLLGSEYLETYTVEALYKAVDLFQRSIDLDPGFALAYVGLGRSYRGMFVRANWLPDDAFEEARKATAKALEIDDELAEAHVLSAQIRFEYDWDMTGAEKELRESIELNPNYSSAYAILGDIMLLKGRYDECHKNLQQAIKLDPNSTSMQGFLGISYYLVGQTDSAIQYLQDRINLNPNERGFRFWLGLVNLEAGDYEAAIEELEKVVSMDSVTQHYRACLGIACARAGMLEETRKHLDIFDRMDHESSSVSFGKAALLAELGETDSSLEMLRKAYDERNQLVFYIKPYKSWFSTIRSDPDFIEFYDRIWSEYN